MIYDGHKGWPEKKGKKPHVASRAMKKVVVYGGHTDQ
jgi:hypothetical protein